MDLRRRSAISPRPCALLALALLTSLAAGCAAFKSSKRLDVGPFAENTVGMIGEVQRANKPVVWTYLKKYESLPTVTDVRRIAIPARTLMRGVAMYSTQLVSIYESDLPASRKCQELALYLDDAVRHRIEINPTAQFFISPGALDSAVTRVGKSTDFLAALGGAQAVVSAALAYGNFLYDSLDVQIDRAAADIDRRIEEEFAPVKWQAADLTDLQLRRTRGYTLLSQYRYGNEAALDTLRAIDPRSAAALPAGKRPPAPALDATEKRLLSELETTAQLLTVLNQHMEEYKAEQLELDQLRIQAREGSRLGRITLILWARSHKNLAAGVTVPAAINVMGMMQSAASKAAGIAVP
jgi:hypothetical protein